jgi:TIR domain
VAEVFINYRTGDGDEAAEHIATYLSDRFGKEHVFKASHSIPPGEFYPQALIGAAQECDVLLSVMGPDWGAAPQLEDEADWVRKEILAAQSTGARVVPVLKGRRTDRLIRDSLPTELRWLAELHSLRLDMHESTTDLARIGNFLADLVLALKTADGAANESGPPDTSRNSATNNTGSVTQGRDFTGDVRNLSLNDTHGPTMAGDHNIQNNLSLIAARLKQFQQLQQPIDHLRWLDDRFFPPPGFAEARAIIQELRTVVLTGPPGSGRTAAGQMLAFRSWSGSGMLHELDPQEPDDGSLFHIDLDLIGRGDGMWVDLSDASPRFWNQLQRELPALHKRVQECDAHLVIIQPYGLGLPTSFRPHLRPIDRPQQAEVFGHLLRTEGLASGEDLPAPDFLKDQRSMAEVRQFVDDILSAKDQPEVKGGLNEWIAAAEQPTSPREALVSGTLGDLSSASERALLLTVAMLHGAHADVIDRAAADLLAGPPGESDAGLGRPPLGERLRKVGAETDAARHVRFTRPVYKTAVPLFFWRHFPELHGMIANWVSETLDSDGLSDDDRMELARRFAMQCFDDRYRRRWTALVRHLTSQGPNSSRELAAAAILQVGLGDEANSRGFRRQIYEWSTSRETSDSLATALVAACHQMTETHPGEALVRLHHLARHHPGRADIWDSLVDVVYSDGRLLRLLLTRLADRPFERTLAVDARIFLHVADPARLNVRRPTGQSLIAQADVSRQLAAGWALAYTRLPGEVWEPRVLDWLGCAVEDNANQRGLVDLLVNGARQAPAVLPQLYSLARRAAFRNAITDLVLEKISAAQGVELP